MKILFGALLKFNCAWGLIFLGFQVLTTIIIEFDGHPNIPYTLKEYVANGGNKLDYYTGYAFVTCNDSKNNTESDRWVFNLTSKSYFRYIYLLFYFCVWMAGLILWDVFAHYRYPNIWPRVINNMPVGIVREEVENPSKSTSVLTIVMIIITTSISLYGIYYTNIYIAKFWLK